MASKLITLAPHEAPNQLELSLREAYTLVKPKLTPPLKLTIPSPEGYLTLNKAIIYGVLCEPHLAKLYIKYLHAVVNDGYCLFINLVSQIVDLLYSKMFESCRIQLLWVASVMIDVCGVGFDGLLVSLLRQIVGGDFSDGNLWLSFEMVNLFVSKWDSILDEEPLVLCSGLYTYLRLLTDHYRLAHRPKVMELKRKEIGFCVRMLREQFHLCLRIGRDLVRLLQDLVHIPEFRAVWKLLLLNPSSFGASGFSDISCIYGMRTSSRYFLLRITPEMETQLRFLLTHVKLGSQRRHQAWFTRKFLFVPERETLISDIVRFICCAHHPSNEIIQSDVIPRWAVIGWLLKLCSKKYFEANVKLTLFYDWLFFDEKVDNVMNVEPAMLLMVNSIPRYVDITNSLLEFLLLVVNNYDMDRKNVISKGVSSAISMLVTKGVIGSLDVFISCNLLSPFVKEMLQKFMVKVQSGTCKEPQAPKKPLSDMSSQTLPNSSDSEIQIRCAGFPACPRNAELRAQRNSVLTPTSSAASFSKDEVDNLANLIGKIKEFMKSSSRKGQQLVENILHLYINPTYEKKFGGIGPEYLACELKKELELAGYSLFSPLGSHPNSIDVDDEVQSVTAAVIRTFIISQHQRIREMLFWWSRNGCLVEARLLSYALRLAHEAHEAGYGANYTSEINYKKMPLLKWHIEGYLAHTSGIEDHVSGTITPAPEVAKILIIKMIDSAFTSYRSIFTHARDALGKEVDMIPGKLLSMDVSSCASWKRKSIKVLICSIFSYLPDQSLSDEDVILLLISHMDDAELLYMQMDLGLKRLTIFGEDVKRVLQLIRRSVNWKQVDQHKIWSLIRSELAVSDFPVEKLLLGCFFSTDFDSKASGIAVGGLLALCSSCAPTPKIIGAVMLLPNDKFPDFAAAVLSHWTITNASMFTNSVADFLNKLEDENRNAPLDWSGVLINQSAILFLLEYFKVQGEQGVNMLEKLALKLADVDTRSGKSTVPMDTG